MFHYITRPYSLSAHGIYMTLTGNLLPKEHRRVWEQARERAEEIRQTNAAHSVGAKVLPNCDPEWNNTLGGILARD